VERKEGDRVEGKGGKDKAREGDREMKMKGKRRGGKENGINGREREGRGSRGKGKRELEREEF